MVLSLLYLVYWSIIGVVEYSWKKSYVLISQIRIQFYPYFATKRVERQWGKGFRWID